MDMQCMTNGQGGQCDVYELMGDVIRFMASERMVTSVIGGVRCVLTYVTYRDPPQTKHPNSRLCFANDLSLFTVASQHRATVSRAHRTMSSLSSIRAGCCLTC